MDGSLELLTDVSALFRMFLRKSVSPSLHAGRHLLDTALLVNGLTHSLATCRTGWDPDVARRCECLDAGRGPD